MSTTEPASDESVRLDLFSNPQFDRGASRIKEFCWLAVSGLLIESWLPGSRWRRLLLRAFGAKIGEGVVIKPRVRVKFPWRLEIGINSWIGESVWIDNLSMVTIGPNCCLSQGAYLCTGSHDWTDQKFGLISAPIVLGNGCWIGAKAALAPGTQLDSGAVLTMKSVASGKLAPWTIYSGNPAESTKPRRMRSD